MFVLYSLLCVTFGKDTVYSVESSGQWTRWG